MKVEVNLDYKKLGLIEDAFNECLVKTADALKTDVQQAQTMPFETGNMQNRSMFVDKSKRLKASIVVDTPYARRLYFHPEYDFSKDENPNAGGKWFETYINGNKKDFPFKKITALLKKRLGG